MIKDIRHTGIVVEDLEASIRFYRGLLGFVTVRQMEESGDYLDNILAMNGIEVTTVKMTAPDGQMIELLKFHSHPREKKQCEVHDIGITHIAFTVDNLDDVYHNLMAEGIKFNSRPQQSPDGYAKVAFCLAPEGTYIELVEVL